MVEQVSDVVPSETQEPSDAIPPRPHPSHPSLDIRREIPNTPLLTQVILGLVDVSKRTTAKLVQLESLVHGLEEQVLKSGQTKELDTNIKAYNWCFEAAAIKNDDLWTALNTLRMTIENDKPRVEWEILLEKLLDWQNMILDSLRTEGQIRSAEIEGLKLEMREMRESWENSEEDLTPS
ncbi:hypothetical protein L211DRAFT_845067 [Terfezia boudieri ATCC MYA-4762]|uniref:Uncharacterized protein n=1 Tax=Terfezia boudieri ATCC MYA-4762 TaxID=1051890 RepID=A0A3N4M558_9PEZI|nr:hypothetical protein L211DRAFT_845067 [Terfezia boudieri ATCC MYA-4762]